ncbi:MAG: hypothetical protein HY868_19275 [Chloroflexi bacterium]|nr:hypothetical protein [Chloroflexota bacterium]
MPLEVDDKGKYFTERISKRGLLVTLSIRGTRAQGTMYLSRDNRLKDEWNNAERFVALTDAKIWSADGARLIRETGLLIVNKDQVDWICPDEPESESKDK